MLYSMNNNFLISGFKCFDGSNNFKLRKLTAVTGSNGVGKSSFIQAILLFRLAIEKNTRYERGNDFLDNAWYELPVKLNNVYELALGTADDIFNEKGLIDNNIVLTLDNETLRIPLPEVGRENERQIDVKFSRDGEREGVPFWRKRNFYYLNTERLGPRYFLASGQTDFLNVGSRGEYTAQVLLEAGVIFKVDAKRHAADTKGETLSQQVNAWLDLICPGVSLTVEPLGSMSARVLLRNGLSPRDNLAPNMGFGVSYVLPIIVTGLIATEGSAFLVENPEAHLHPKGQSTIGFFLGRIAAAGVKVILETHSEHVINGVRRAMLSGPDLGQEDVMIYFFDEASKDNERIKEITVDEFGNLSDFPINFFDQARQDLLEILKLGRK